jgi:hypothetical protein
MESYEVTLRSNDKVKLGKNYSSTQESGHWPGHHVEPPSRPYNRSQLEHLNVIGSFVKTLQIREQVSPSWGCLTCFRQNDEVGHEPFRHGHNMAIIAIYCNTPIYCNYNNMKVTSSATIWAIMTLQYIVIYCNIRDISHVTVDLTVSG